jgi:hypothetical protein
MMPKFSFALAALALTAPALAQGGDTCDVPTTLPGLGSFSFDTTPATTSGFDGLAGCGLFLINQDLFFEVTAPITGELVIDTLGSTFDTWLSVHGAGGCAATCIATNDDSSGLTSEVRILVTAGDELLIQVGGFGTSSGAGLLNLADAGPSCASLPDDMFEDNDDCPTAFLLGDGTYTDLKVLDTDNDYFTFSLDAGATVDASIFFSDAEGDVDLYLWNPLVECDTNVAGTGGAFLVRGFSATDDEVITYTNITGASQQLVLEIDMFTLGGCNTYDLVLAGVSASGGSVGTAYCMAAPNSTGSPSSISGFGSSAAADNQLELTVNGLPQDSFGYFLSATTAAFVPLAGGSQGNLCLGSNIGRFVGDIQVLNSGASGTSSLAVDLTAVPQPGGSVAVNAGETWFFQLWHRDSSSGMSTSNFSDGLEVLFN